MSAPSSNDFQNNLNFFKQQTTSPSVGGPAAGAKVPAKGTPRDKSTPAVDDLARKSLTQPQKEARRSNSFRAELESSLSAGAADAVAAPVIKKAPVKQEGEQPPALPPKKQRGKPLSQPSSPVESPRPMEVSESTTESPRAMDVSPRGNYGMVPRKSTTKNELDDVDVAEQKAAAANRELGQLIDAYDKDKDAKVKQLKDEIKTLNIKKSGFNQQLDQLEKFQNLQDPKAKKSKKADQAFKERKSAIESGKEAIEEIIAKREKELKRLERGSFSDSESSSAHGGYGGVRGYSSDESSGYDRYDQGFKQDEDKIQY